MCSKEMSICRSRLATLVMCVTVGCMFFIGVLIPAPAAAQGDLQVICSPGVSVFIDGSFMGITTASAQGLFLERLATGGHTLTVKKEGFRDQTRHIDISSDLLLVVRFEFVQQREEVTRINQDEAGQLVREVGELILRAVPPRPEAEVFINGVHKGSGDIRVSGVPAGSLLVTWKRPGVTVEHRVVLKGGDTITLKADFRTSEVVNITAIDRASQAEETKRLYNSCCLNECKTFCEKRRGDYPGSYCKYESESNRVWWHWNDLQPRTFGCTTCGEWPF